MRGLTKILIIMMLAVMLGACTVRTADDGTASASDEGSVGIENPFVGSGGEEDDDVIISEGGSSGGSGSSPPAPATPEYDPLEIVTTKFADCYQNLNYYQKLKAKGGSESYEWTITGLPAGISGSKYITGITTASPGNYNVTLTLKDSETEESVSKDISLKVIEFIKEDLEIVVSQFEDGQWKALSPNDGYVDIAILDMEKRRLKLEVIASGGDPASANRFHWSVKSSEDRLSAFVPPYDDGAQTKEGQRAYLMPWGEKNDLEFKILDIVDSDKELIDTEVTVRDDFGNSAQLKIGKIDIEETIFTKCNSLSKDERLHADIPASVDYDVDRLHGKFEEINGELVILDDPGKTDLSAWGGVAPYRWKIGDGDEAVSPHEGGLLVNGDIRALSDIWCTDLKNNPDCSKAAILWQNIKLKVPDINRMSAKIPVEVTDACGSRVYMETELKVQWPHDPFKDKLFSTTATIKESCHTTPNTDMNVLFFSGGSVVAKAHFELDPIACDTTQREYSTGGWYGYWMKPWPHAYMEYPDESTEVGPPHVDRIEVHTTGSGDENGTLGVDLIRLDMRSVHWSNFWYDGAEGKMGEEIGEFHYDITPLVDGWKPAWDSIPPDRRTF